MEKLHPLNYPNISNEVFISSCLSGKMRLLFAIFGIFLLENRARSQVKAVESKFDKYNFIHTIPSQLPVKKNWFKYFLALWLWITNDISEKL